MTKFRKQKFKKEVANKLLKIANDDLYAARILSSASQYRPETVLYHVQQSIEKSLKSVIVWNEQAVPLTHDIGVLMNELGEDFTKNLPQGAVELTQYATIRRYTDGDELIEERDIQESFKIAEVFLSWAKNSVT